MLAFLEGQQPLGPSDMAPVWLDLYLRIETVPPMIFGRPRIATYPLSIETPGGPDGAVEFREIAVGRIAEDGGESAMEAERRRAIAELVEALPPHDALLRWARENPPPQEWFDEDHDLR